MKTKYIFQVIAILAVALITAGCNRELTLKTKLAPEEKVGKGDAVLVDGIAAGHVKSVLTDGGQRLAVLAITDEAGARQKMRAGVVRVIHDGQIDLRTDGVDAQSPMLVNGETVPVMSRTGFAVRRLASNKVLTALLTGLAVVALALFCFRRLARVWLLLLAVVLAGWSAWLALPWASDAVTRIYTLLPQANPTVSVDATQSGDIKSALLHFMHQPPSPEIVAYCGVFLLVFIILSMGVFASLKRFEKQN